MNVKSWAILMMGIIISAFPTHASYLPIVLKCNSVSTSVEMHMSPAMNEAQLFYLSATRPEPVNVYVSAPANHNSDASVRIENVSLRDDNDLSAMILSAKGKQSFSTSYLSFFSLKITKDYTGRYRLDKLSYEQGNEFFPQTWRSDTITFSNLKCTIIGL